MKVYDTPDAINSYRIKTLRSALKLEILGMKKKGNLLIKLLKMSLVLLATEELFLRA